MLYSLPELYRHIALFYPMLGEKEKKKSDEDPWNLVFSAACFQILSFSFPSKNEE